MGSRYLTDLASVCRGAGLWVNEEPGWQSRARGSGGYSSGLPCAVMIHHTASGPSSDGQPDVNYMCYSADARPIANIYLARTGIVWVMAAGATNTNGSGGPLGPVSGDSMNSSAIGIEAGNNGTGEPWPEAQQRAYTQLCSALCKHYGIPVGQVWSHCEWAPGRKIDPAGPSKWAASGTWNEDSFRGDVALYSPGPTPPPTPTPVPPTPTPVPPPSGWVCPPFPGTGDYGCSSGTCVTWQEAMILNGIISDNPSNHDGVWGNGMHNACFGMQQGWGWNDADGVAGEHSWAHLRSRDVAPCPKCGK